MSSDPIRRRDAGLRRINRFTKGALAGGLALTGSLSILAARSFSGATATAQSTTQSTAQSTTQATTQSTTQSTTATTTPTTKATTNTTQALQSPSYSVRSSSSSGRVTSGGS